MVRIVLKNTFLTLDENPEDDPGITTRTGAASPHPAALLRSRSADTPTSRGHESLQPVATNHEDRAAFQIEELNRLWSPEIGRPAESSPQSRYPCFDLLPQFGLPTSWLAASSLAESSDMHQRQHPESLECISPRAIASHCPKDTSEAYVPELQDLQKLTRVWSSTSVSTTASNSCTPSIMASEHTEPQLSWLTVDNDDTSERCLSFPSNQDSCVTRKFQSPKSFPKDGFESKDYHHKHVPKHVNLKEEFANNSRNVPPTTVMLRNIPNSYTQDELITELEEFGFASTYDFLYLPLDQGRRHRKHGTRSTMSSVGYAFVNFVEHAWMEKFMTAFQNYSFKRHVKNVSRSAIVNLAHLQGLEANLAHYGNTKMQTAKSELGHPWFMGNAF